MKECRIWKLKWGRMTAYEALIGASSFDDAVKVALEIMKAAKPEWNPDQDDILSLVQTTETVRMLDGQ